MEETTTLIRRRDEGEATWFFNALMTTKAGMAETAGAYSLTEHLVTAASNPPMHVQVDEDEAFYILEDFFVGMGEPATARVLPTPTAPDEARLAALCARTNIELV